jgi:phosphatidyl-myo-inositol dimannoside synthase
VRHLLVTNDYPPKVGGIQSYLWELYRRLPADEVIVLTRRHRGWQAFDAEQQHRIIRPTQPVLVPEPVLARQIRDVVAAERIDLVMYDPAVPVGALGPRMGLPYGVILHGAEVTIPGRLPGTRAVLGEVLRKSSLVASAGAYCAAEAERAARTELPVVIIPPGVDTHRMAPLAGEDRERARASYGLEPDAEVVLTLSRLVPRKGMDRLIEAVARLAPARPRLTLLVAGDGRDRGRLERLATDLEAPVRFLDRVPDNAMAQLYASADVFAMMCRSRWAGLEQEGFGIVFVEAAACGVAQMAGDSGGAAEAVADGQTGVVVNDPRDQLEVAAALSAMLDDDVARAAMGRASRERAVAEFDYDLLARRFQCALTETVGGLR